MAFDLASKSSRRFSRPSWAGAAFIVEALFLLLFLAASAAIFVQLFAHAATQASESVELSRAVAFSSEIAERFTADPASIEGPYEIEGLVATCDITQEQRDDGILYQATITVHRDPNGRVAKGDGKADVDLTSGAVVYTITTARYVGGGSS